MSKLSVIIPCYNHELFIGRCLRSILDQTLDKKLYKVIVIDDGSKDNSLKIIKKFSDNIKIIKNKKNMGLPYSVNLGIKNAKSNYIVRLDPDDYVNKNFFVFFIRIYRGK